MLDLSRRPHVGASGQSNTALSHGGDTLNTAVYLSRLGLSVRYVTALGDDPLSSEMIESWQQENIDCSLVDRHDGAVPGLYFIDTDAAGERSFLYWTGAIKRRQSASLTTRKMQSVFLARWRPSITFTCQGSRLPSLLRCLATDF